MAKQNPGPAAASPSPKAPPGTKRNARPAGAPAARPQATRPAAPVSRAVAQRPGGREGAGLAGRLAGLQRGFRETVAELRKVQWPDRLTTRNLTLVVIGMSVTLSALLGLFDGLLTRLFEWLIKV